MRYKLELEDYGWGLSVEGEESLLKDFLFNVDASNAGVETKESIQIIYFEIDNEDKLEQVHDYLANPKFLEPYYNYIRITKL